MHLRHHGQVTDRRVAARHLRLHALVFGVGWFVVAFGALVGLGSFDRAQNVVADLPHALQGAGLIVVAVVALPLAWPVYLAVGLLEAGLADRIRHGDAGARSTARVLLHGEAIVSMLVALGLVAFTISVGPRNGREYLVLMWLPLALIALAHERTARAIGATS
jgi:hypothetical protein